MASKFSKLIVGTMNWGAWGAKCSIAEFARNIEGCYAMGLTTFDHADIYGDYTTEAAFGAAFKTSGIPRAKVQFISKCGIGLTHQERGNYINHYNYTEKYILSEVARSLAQLQTDYLDVLLLHRPSPLMNPLEIKAAVDQLLKKGMIKSFGVSNFLPSQTDLIRKELAVEVNQIEISLATNAPMFNGQLDHCLANRITPMAWAPLGGLMGPLQNKVLETALNNLCKKYATTRDVLLLAWLLKHPAGIIPVLGTTKLKRHKVAATAIEIDFEIQDWFYLLAAYRGHDIP